jgi:IS5 family transposase
LCIGKGKEHKKYESGNKVSVITSIRGVILGALSFGNEYDGHTTDRSLEQARRLTGKVPKLLAGDRGYRGQKQSGDTRVMIPGVPLKSDSRYKRRKKRELFCKRAGIEPKISHLKSDHRLGRNFYRGVQGDAINIMPAAAFNFKRAMRVLLWLITKAVFMPAKTQPVRLIDNSNRIG